ncbi:MAG: PfkB family carbohydrate kinase [Acidimicrobiales bacterium]
MTTRHVVVVGDVMLDVVVRPKAPLAPTSDTPSSIRVSRGGSGANVAIAIQASGHEVRYVGAAGRDAACDVFLDSLHESDVMTQLELVDVPTGTVVSLVGGDGQRMMLSDRGANVRLDEAFVAERLEEPFDHLHVSGYLLLDDSTRTLAEHALLKAQQRGRSTSIDACSVAPLREVTPDVFLRAASFASQLFANEEEALVLTSTSDPLDALDVLSRLFDDVVVTLGENGAIGARGPARYAANALPVGVFDTTGAGDAATGAYIGARLRDESPHRSLELAMEAAAAVLGGLGARG